MLISEFLDIRPGITALIGGGGKTTLMYTLAEELISKGAVICCTSTHIRIPEGLTVVTGGRDELRSAIREKGVICAGTPSENRKLTAHSLGFDELCRLADYVLTEADGARGLPLKAHESYEPVIPEGTGKTVLVIGADGLGKRIEDVCHRSGIWASLAGVTVADKAAPELEARVVMREGFGDIVLINKTESADREKMAEELAGCLKLPTLVGSLERKSYRKWD